MNTFENNLIEIVQTLDISPSDFERARTRYRAVKEWLLSGQYVSGYLPIVYLQGSFRLGTVIRPYFADKDGDFDIDQVCEITKPAFGLNPATLKKDIGDRLKSNATYSRMLDDEGKRCWTLIYASEESKPGFHLDVLPSRTSSLNHNTEIDITDKNKVTSVYNWSNSDPNGYYRWFKSKNTFSDDLLRRQSIQIFERNTDLYLNSEEVPKQLIRSPLQRSIQLMKRHRDVYFTSKSHKPISIILTTIAAHKYSGHGIDDTISTFTDYAIGRHQDLLRDGFLAYDGILDYIDGNWWVANPVHFAKSPADRENFADKWNVDTEYALAFFEWVRALKRSFSRFEKSGFSDDLNLKVPSVGEGKPFPSFWQEKIKEGISRGTANSNDLLSLIHLGIEGKVAWATVKNVSEQYLKMSTEEKSEDICKINWYQIARHRNHTLSLEARNDIRTIINKYPGDSGFVMCGNILLNSVTKDMIKNCIRDVSYDDVLTWPIMALVNRVNLLP